MNRRSGAERRHRVPLGGVDIDPLTQDEVVEHVFDCLQGDQGGQLLTANVDHLRQVRAGGELAGLYEGADLAVADGMPLVWASRVAGMPVPERVTGADLLWSLSEGAARTGSPVYLLGGRDGAAQRTAELLVERYPGLRIAGTSCPPPGFEEDPALLETVLHEAVAQRPGLVFTGLGAPKQERVNALLGERLPSSWFVGVGAAFDMAAGDVRRAPKAVQVGGMEWLFRLVQEPRRLARRYLLDGMPVVLRLLWTGCGHRRRSLGTPPARPAVAAPRPARPRSLRAS